MKKILIFALVVASVILVGCGNQPGVSLNGNDIELAKFTERNVYASEERSCFCVVNKDDISAMLDAAERKDAKYLDDMLVDGRAFVVRELTKVKCSNTEVRRGIVLVNFLEGEFKGRWAYTFSKRVR